MTDLEPGMFSWTDLSTTDAAGARRFYAELFGWEAEEMPAGDHGTYTMFRRDGRDVAGMSEQPPDMREAGMPPVWNSYVLVEGVDDTTRRAAELGGSVVMEPMDVLDAGRMSVVGDPTGGVLCLWEAGNHTGAGVFNEHGALTWNELATRDAETAARFYGELLGWEYDTMPMHGTTYRIAKNAGRPNGGIMEMTDEWPAEVPAHWMVYFNVTDVDRATDRVKELGGGVTVAPKDIGMGRMSVVTDPQGGTFSLFQPTEAAASPE